MRAHTDTGIRLAALVLLLATTAAASAAGQPVTDAEACLEAGANPALRLALCERALAGAALPPASRATLLTRRGELWLALQQPDLARADFDAALRNNPGAATALRGRALLAQRADNLEAALADLSRAIALSPRNGELRGLRAAVRHQNGQPAGAEADIAAALALRSDDRFALLLRGALRYRQGDFDAAAADFRDSLSGGPVTYPLAAFWLAMARGRAGADPAAALSPYAWWWQDSGWPEGLVAALRGEQDIDSFARAVDAMPAPGQRAQAAFFAAQLALLRDRPAPARRLLDSAVRFGAPATLEAVEARAQRAGAGG